ncbi:Endonuclease/exonuclease/phosphatase [Multifurca ochricompacta]|uniref:DNA-(apurinic or apyrimidinic site) endonuclease 2 n=1 Tax=Multifurca ochricompacta TaxID=376703 RepID=A0AAD4MBH9_9AGAM|nr:Endonuclease/exonuclease/phosphatase [Multifurca ochricompacta]
MRILSWNLNGVRTIPQYHPWNTFKNWDAILKELQADIICFQEMKTSRYGIGRDVALPDSFDSFFSFPASKGGYSGVAVYTNTRTAMPLKAEEGLSGCLQSKPPLSADERISTSYPAAHELDLVPDPDEQIPNDLLSLDLEGRALILDFGLFVLVNLYCPNEGSDMRFSYKMNYHLMLQERVRRLMAAGREVVVVGDLNVCAAPIDHCDGHLPSNASTFWEHPVRAWMRDWLAPRGFLIDGMYTCWNTKISARETNYGTRIDYVLITPGLLPWIKASDIQPSIKGSTTITTNSGRRLVLRDLMHIREDTAKREPPRLAAKHWPEFQGKQMLMSSFFTKRGAEIKAQPPSLAAASDAIDAQLPPPFAAEPPAAQASQALSSQPVTESSSSPLLVSSSSSQPFIKPPQASHESRKRAPRQKRLKAGQLKLSSFFSKTTTSEPPNAFHQANPSDIIDLCEDSEELPPPRDSTPASQGKENANGKESAASWSALFTPILPPLCAVHREPTKEYRVNKPGPNKGKTFFLCARPVGPGYDKGRSERLREEVDHQYKCDFFKWASDVKREAKRIGASGTVEGTKS